MAIRLLVVSDCDARREVITTLCRRCEIGVSAISGSGTAVLEHLHQGPPDVALIEAEVSVEAALSTLKLVRQQAPDVPVLIHPAGNDPGLRMQAFLLGACGLLPVCCSRRRYIQTIRMAACGNHVWSPRDTRDAEGLACGSR